MCESLSLMPHVLVEKVKIEVRAHFDIAGLARIWNAEH